MTVNTNGEYGPAEPYPYRNTLGDPWPAPEWGDRRNPGARFLPELRLPWYVRAWDAIVDTLLGRR